MTIKQILEAFKNAADAVGDCEVVIMCKNPLGPVHFYGPIDGKVFLCDFEYISKQIKGA